MHKVTLNSSFPLPFKCTPTTITQAVVPIKSLSIGHGKRNVHFKGKYSNKVHVKLLNAKSPKTVNSKINNLVHLENIVLV